MWVRSKRYVGSVCAIPAPYSSTLHARTEVLKCALSQVVLSFGIPFALIPLLIFCRNRNVMGTLVNHRLTTAIATVVVTLIVSLNVFLLYQTFLA